MTLQSVLSNVCVTAIYLLCLLFNSHLISYGNYTAAIQTDRCRWNCKADVPMSRRHHLLYNSTWCHCAHTRFRSVFRGRNFSDRYCGSLLFQFCCEYSLWLCLISVATISYIAQELSYLMIFVRDVTMVEFKSVVEDFCFSRFLYCLIKLITAVRGLKIRRLKFETVLYDPTNSAILFGIGTWSKFPPWNFIYARFIPPYRLVLYQWVVCSESRKWNNGMNVELTAEMKTVSFKQ